MPLPLLLIPLAVTAGSAVAQIAGKLRARHQLNQLRSELAEARQRHRCLMVEYYLRQDFLCRQLGLERPPRPAPLLPPPEADAAEPASRFSRLRRFIIRRIRPPKTTLTQGSIGSARFIVGRHSASVVSSIIWRNFSSSAMGAARTMGLRLFQPVGSRLLTLAPRLTMFGGGTTAAGGSIFASTVARVALSSISVAGIILGPALAAWSIWCEMRKVRRARQELQDLLAEAEAELTVMVRRNRELEAQWTELNLAAALNRLTVGAGAAAAPGLGENR